MHSSQSPYDANGWNSMQNGHYRPQPMSYHYPQNRGQMPASKPTQIDTRHHHMNAIRHNHPHQSVSNTNRPVNHQYNTNHRKARPPSYSVPRSEDNTAYLQQYRSPTPDSSSNMRYNPQRKSNPMPTIPHISESTTADPNNHYNHSKKYTQSNNHQRCRTHSANASYNRLQPNAMHEPSATMHTMHKFKSNDSSNHSNQSNHSIYSPDSIRSQPAPQIETQQNINNMKKNKSFTLYDEAQQQQQQQTKATRSRTLSGRNQSNHHYNHTVPIPNINEIMVFSPTNNKEMNIPNNIGLAEYKQPEYIEQEYYDKGPRMRRADTAPHAPHYNNNVNQRNYGFMTSVDENVEYGFDGRQHPRNRNQRQPPSRIQHNAAYMGSPIFQNQATPHSMYGSPIYSNQQQQPMTYNPMQYNQYNPMISTHPMQQSPRPQSESISSTDSDSTDSNSRSSDESDGTDFIESETVSTDESYTESSSRSRSLSSPHTDSVQTPSKSATKSPIKTPTKSRKKRRKRKSKRKAKRSKKHSMKRRKNKKMKAQQHHTKGKPSLYSQATRHSHRSITELTEPDLTIDRNRLNHHKDNNAVMLTPHLNDEVDAVNAYTTKYDPPSHLYLIETKVSEKSKKTAVLLRSILKRQMLFIGLEDAILDDMVATMYIVECTQNECIMKQNEIGNALFVIESGKFIIIRNDKVIGTATAKSMIGEGALLYSKPRRTTFKAKDNCIVWALDSEEFMKIRHTLLLKYKKKSDKKVKFLSKMKLFRHFDIMDIVDIAEATRPILYRKGANIMTENEQSTHFFIVYKGRCEGYDINGDKMKLICQYQNGNYFGDKGIIANIPSDHRVIATSDDVICYVLNAIEFIKYLAPNITNKYTPYKPPQIHAKFANILKNNMEQFKHIGVIGVGTFAEISLVEDPNTNTTYALKKIRKNRVIEKRCQHHIVHERAVLCTLNSGFCVQLYATFQNELNVYLVTEAILGGELYYLLKFNKRFPEKTARFYAANVVLAFEHIHAKNVIFRDLKPQNLLVSANGYIKLIDFGFAKIRSDSCTLCGTAEYLAPEIIQCSQQSFTTDWWTLGILIFEMIVGNVPFRDDLNVKMYEKILSSSVNFPSKIKMSRTGKDLITSLLRKHSYKRLGSGLCGAAQIKKHQWFQSGFNWNKFEKQQIQPPYVPNIAHNKDTSNFEKFKKQRVVETLMNDPNGELYAWCEQF